MLIMVALLMLPVTIVAGAVITPTLWRVETRLGMELAGHSGPSSWILWTIWALLTAATALVLRAFARPKP
jgi:hypothetical protein